MLNVAVEVEQSPVTARRLLTAGALLGIVLIALPVRLHRLNDQSLFLDEFWNLELATGRGSLHLRLPSETLLSDLPRVTSLTDAPGLLAIPGNMDHVTHPPLYSMVLRAWCELFGMTDTSGRVLSTIFSALAIVVLFDAVRILNRSGVVALWAALIMALAGAQIELAQEVRPYTFLLLLGMGAIDATARIEVLGAGKLRLTALGFCALSMLLTHYFSAAAIGALMLYAAYRLHGTHRLWTIGSVLIACAVFAILWGPSMLAQSASLSDGDGWLRVDEPNHLFQTLRRLAILPMLMLFNPPRNLSNIIYLSCVVLVIPLLLLRRRPQLLLWVLWFFATVIAMAAMEQVRSTRHLEFIRYTILAAPALYVMLAELVPPPPPSSFGWMRNVVPGVVVLCCALSLPAAYFPWKPNYRELARFVDEQHVDGAPVVFCTPHGSSTGAAEMFIGTSHYSKTFPWPTVLLENRPRRELLAQLRDHPTVIVIAAQGGLMSADLFPGERVDPPARLVPYLATIERVHPRNPTTLP